MKRTLTRIALAFFALSLLCLSACSARSFLPLRILPSPEEESQEYVPAKEFYGLGKYEPEGFLFSGRVFLIGDSTVCGAYSDYRMDALDLMGWGRYLSYYLKPEEKEEKGAQGVSVYNYALSGGSSLSYLGSAGYDQLLKDLSKGDYLIIQFGHNDQDENAADHTSAELSRADVNKNGVNEAGVYSFEWVLYEKYIKLAQSVGAVPILVSPTALRNVKTGLGNVAGHEPYRKVMQSLAEECSIPFLDLTGETVALYQQMVEEGGVKATECMHAYTDLNHVAIDAAHFSRYGAYRIAGLVASSLAESEIALSNFIEEPRKTITSRDSE